MEHTQKVKTDMKKNSDTLAKEFRMHFSKEIKNARLRKNLSQMELSEIMGVHQDYVSRIENGKVNISLDTMIKLAFHLDLSLKLKPLEGRNPL